MMLSSLLRKIWLIIFHYSSDYIKKQCTKFYISRYLNPDNATKYQWKAFSSFSYQQTLSVSVFDSYLALKYKLQFGKTLI